MSDLSRPISLHLPKRIEFGAGTARMLGSWAEGHQRVLVIASRSTRALAGRLGLAGSSQVFGEIPAEPKDIDLDAALAVARDVRPTLVVGLGGGSVMDVAKLVAVLWDSDQQPLEVAGPNKVARSCAALAQVPTTAGTGSEAGIRALFTNSATGMKVAVESPLMLADIAIIDPELTLSVPPATTAATGIDALAHCVEAFTSLRSHPLIDGYARLGMTLVGRHLRRAVEDGADMEARAGMMLASFYGGLCLGPVNTAAGHAVAYPLGTRAGLPHGLANALIFPHVLAFNTPVVADKTRDVLSALGLPPSSDPDAVRAAATGYCRGLGLEMKLSRHGIHTGDLRPWAEEAHAIRRLMDNNPRPMSAGEVEDIYRAAF